MVLWIGYLQWHFRTYGNVNPPEPVLRDFHNIEYRDALLSYSAVEPITDGSGKPVTRWDGLTYKTSPITGKAIPDESMQIEQYRYIKPRKAEWPRAEYIVGNPPFIGASTMRRALGDGYVDALRSTWPEVPESADFVMHWWHIAAETVRAGKAQRFGFITTNSVKQTFNRRVIESQLPAKPPLSLAFAIPDHPWVDSGDGAAVRIAMTVGTACSVEGRLLTVLDERETGHDEVDVVLLERQGTLLADLNIGANVAGCKGLQANAHLSNRGVCLFGAGFIVSPDQAQSLGYGAIVGIDRHIRHYRNGKDLAQTPRGAMVIDLFGLSLEEVRDGYPAVYQWVLERVKPERDHNNRESRRRNWWLFGETNPKLRDQLLGLPRYIATVETAKHRVFQFLDASILPDNMLVNVASDDANILGVLSSRLHVAWALAAGGRLGVGNDARYNKSRCFETFPFPDATPQQLLTIRELAEKLDAHRKRQQAAHPGLTLTGMYNVLEKARTGVELTDKEKTVHAQALGSLLRELHDALDRAVFHAYGWEDLGNQLVGLPGATTPLADKPEAQNEAEEELLHRLVTLNAERAAAETRGASRWLRPEYQNPGTEFMPPQVQTELETETDEDSVLAPKSRKLAWPKVMREQIAAVRNALATESQSIESLAAKFKDPKKTTPLLIEALAALEELGMVYLDGTKYRLAT
jgi:hypothetical protein